MIDSLRCVCVFAFRLVEEGNGEEVGAGDHWSGEGRGVGEVRRDNRSKDGTESIYDELELFFCSPPHMSSCVCDCVTGRWVFDIETDEKTVATKSVTDKFESRETQYHCQVGAGDEDEDSHFLL